MLNQSTFSTLAKQDYEVNFHLTALLTAQKSLESEQVMQ